MKSKVRIPIAALGAILICCPAAFSQQIPCPVASDITNTSHVSNSMNPCQINSGVTFANFGLQGILTNASPSATLVTAAGGTLSNGALASVINDSLIVNNGSIINAGTLLNGNSAASATLLNQGVLQNNANGTLVNGFSPSPPLPGPVGSYMLLNVSGASLINLGQLSNNDVGTLGNSGDLTNLGSLNNAGTFNNNGGTINNLGTLTNTGALSSSGAIINFHGATFTNQDLMANNSGGSIKNSGTFNSGGLTNNAAIENSSLFSADTLTNNSGATIVNDSFSFLFANDLTDNGTLTNNGTINTVGGGTVKIGAGGTVINNGVINSFATLDVQPGGVLDNQAGGSFTQDEGQTIVDGTLNTLPALQFISGVLSGTGTINGSVDNVAAFVQPGDAPGTLTINGNYTQGLFGNLTVDLGGNGAGEFSVLDVSGLAALGGTLDFTAVNGFTPGTGDDFTFLLFGAMSGEFANVDFTNWTCPVGDTCTVVGGSNSLTLEIASAGSTTSTPEPSMLPLLGMGILAMGAYSRRKRGAAAIG